MRFVACLCAASWMVACAARPSVVLQTRTVEVPVARFVDIPAHYTAPVPSPQPGAPRCSDKGVQVLCGDQLVDWIEDGWLPVAEYVNARFAAIACLSRAVTAQQRQTCMED
jgi:hypothetical protein